MKYVPLMLLTANREAGLCVNMMKDNIEIESKENALIISGLKITL